MRRPHRSIPCLALLLLAGCAAPRRAAAPEELLAVVRAQEAAWNRGDLDAFMAEGYWSSPELTFFSGGDDTRGYAAMLERYRERYTRGGREMGKLSFTELETVVLAHDAALVRGRWRVEFGSAAPVAGLFTLALRKQPEGWRIVHDHTSASED